MSLRRLSLAAACAASLLLMTAQATWAGMEFRTAVLAGTATSSQTATRSCGFSLNRYGSGELLIRCRGSKGRAVARYTFALPGKPVGKPSFHVFATKLCCSGSRIVYQLKKKGSRRYVAVVRARRQTRLNVQSLSLSYYLKK